MGTSITSDKQPAAEGGSPLQGSYDAECHTAAAASFEPDPAQGDAAAMPPAGIESQALSPNDVG